MMFETLCVRTVYTGAYWISRVEMVLGGDGAEGCEVIWSPVRTVWVTTLGQECFVLLAFLMHLEPENCSFGRITWKKR